MSSRLHLQSYVYDGYAAHISTLQNYYDRSMELLDTCLLYTSAKNTVRKVTETPNYSDKGAKTMKIIGAVLPSAWM